MRNSLLRKVLIQAAIFLTALFVIDACARLGKEGELKPDKEYIYPSAQGWSVAAPEKYGFDSSKLDFDAISSESSATGLMVIAGGESIWEWGNTSEYACYIASCRKSILIALYGKYIESGAINLRASLSELGIDDIGGLSDLEKSAKVQDVLTCRSGVYHEASNAGSDVVHMPERNSKKPGTYYLYNNWDFNLAGYLLEQAAGKTVYQLVDEDLAAPLEFQDWHLDKQKYGGDPTLSQYKAYHMYISVRDLARFGLMMLSGGKWNGRQIVNSSWIKEITSEYSTLAEVSGLSGDFSYGYMWWLFDDNGRRVQQNSLYHSGYMAQGAGGKYLAILPEVDLVIAYKNADNNGNLEGMYKVIDAFLDAYNPALKK